MHTVVVIYFFFHISSSFIFSFIFFIIIFFKSVCVGGRGLTSLVVAKLLSNNYRVNALYFSS